MKQSTVVWVALLLIAARTPVWGQSSLPNVDPWAGEEWPPIPVAQLVPNTGLNPPNTTATDLPTHSVVMTEDIDTISNPASLDDPLYLRNFANLNFADPNTLQALVQIRELVIWDPEVALLTELANFFRRFGGESALESLNFMQLSAAAWERPPLIQAMIDFFNALNLPHLRVFQIDENTLITNPPDLLVSASQFPDAETLAVNVNMIDVLENFLERHRHLERVIIGYGRYQYAAEQHPDFSSMLSVLANMHNLRQLDLSASVLGQNSYESLMAIFRLRLPRLEQVFFPHLHTVANINWLRDEIFSAALAAFLEAHPRLTDWGVDLRMIDLDNLHGPFHMLDHTNPHLRRVHLYHRRGGLFDTDPLPYVTPAQVISVAWHVFRMNTRFNSLSDHPNPQNTHAGEFSVILGGVRSLGEAIRSESLTSRQGVVRVYALDADHAMRVLMAMGTAADLIADDDRPGFLFDQDAVDTSSYVPFDDLRIDLAELWHLYRSGRLPIFLVSDFFDVSDLPWESPWRQRVQNEMPLNEAIGYLSQQWEERWPQVSIEELWDMYRRFYDFILAHGAEARQRARTLYFWERNDLWNILQDADQGEGRSHERNYVSLWISEIPNVDSRRLPQAEKNIQGIWFEQK